MRDETSPNPRRLAEVVIHAANLEGPERRAYLAEIAVVDPVLVTEVRERLAAAQDISTFLERPAADRLGETPFSEESGLAVSLPAEQRYELGRCLGEGGMGRVVEAHDRQLGRQVALKMLTDEDSHKFDAFLREGRAQARVRHAHVLEVFDGGELEGRPFLSMRHVNGGTLAEMAPGLSLEHRIRLLIQAAEGLHAAHRVGLLHRDVKPSNILVEMGPDGDLSAFVSDFGIAADIEDSSWLATQAAGTPYFIAPECLTHPSTTFDRRSDVYSLGVTIYQILTANLPYSGGLTVDILRQAAHEEPTPPREHDPNLPAEVEAIILRCMARNPEKRYASARAVAEDLQRYLDGEVVESYAAGLAYRLTRFVLRNRVLVSLAILAAVALLFSSVAVTLFAVRANAARQEAELRQGLAEELISFMVVDLQEKLEPVSRLAVLDDIARAAMDYFAAVPRDEISEVELLRHSRMLYQLGELRIRQGDLEAAARPLDDALALTRRLHRLSPGETGRLFELGQSWFWVGYVAWQLGDLNRARASFEEYLGVSEGLVDIDVNNFDWQLELSYAHSNLGSVLQAEGQLDAALARFTSSLEIKERLVEAEPTRASWRSDLADSHNTVAVIFLMQRRMAEARRHFENELTIRRALFADAPENRQVQSALATTYAYLAKSFATSGEPDHARSHAEEARRLLRELLAHDPDHAETRTKLTWIDLDLGRLAFARGDISGAEAAWRGAENVLETLLTGDGEPRSARTAQGALLYHFALARWARGEEQARGDVLSAINVFEDLAAEQPLDHEASSWWGWSYLLSAFLETSPAAAEAAFRRAEEILEAPSSEGSAEAQGPVPPGDIRPCLDWVEDIALGEDKPSPRAHVSPDLLFCQHFFKAKGATRFAASSAIASDHL